MSVFLLTSIIVGFTLPASVLPQAERLKSEGERSLQIHLGFYAEKRETISDLVAHWMKCYGKVFAPLQISRLSLISFSSSSDH